MKSKRIITALAMLLVSAVLLSTASYAWFAMNTNVSANGLTIGAYSDSLFLQIKTSEDDDYKTQTSFTEDNVGILRLTTPSYYNTNTNLDFVTVTVPTTAATVYETGKVYYKAVKSDMGGFDYIVADMSAYKSAAASIEGLYSKAAFVLQVTHTAPQDGYTYYSYDYATDTYTAVASPAEVYSLYAVANTYTGETGEYNGSGTYYKLEGGKYVNVSYTLYQRSQLPAKTYYVIDAGNDVEEATTATAGVDYYVRNVVSSKFGHSSAYEYSYVGQFAAGTVLADELLWGRAYSSELTNAQTNNSLTYIPEAKQGDYYLMQTLNIRQAENTNNATNLRIENVTITGATNPIANALRILFVATSSSGKTTTAHYNPRNDVGNNNGVEDAILFDTLLGDAQETITVQIYMYFDGTDAITYTSAINDATLNGQNIQIEFAIDELSYN